MDNIKSPSVEANGMMVNILPGEALASSGKVKSSNTTGSKYTLKGGGPETWRLSHFPRLVFATSNSAT